MYWVMHGSYGVCWVLKDICFPDKGFQGKMRIMSASLVWIVGGPYYLFGYALASRQVPEPSKERVILACFVYVVGIVLMMGSDAQKYFTLKYK